MYVLQPLCLPASHLKKRAVPQQEKLSVDPKDLLLFLFVTNIMQLKHIESLTQPSAGITKVTAICWSPNAKKLAVCTTDRMVLMFDENGARKDKFSTKPAEKVCI